MINFYKTLLSKENTLSIRGVTAILILFSHLQLFWPISNIGYLCVAVFFFFSGYGLKHSLETKKYYLNGFLKKRLPAIIIPYWTACLFYIGFIAVLGYYFSVEIILWSFINPFIDTFRYVSVSWYVCVIFLFYILFYVSYRLFRKKLAFYIIVISIILYCVVLYYLKIKPDYWVMSVSTFLLGILIASIKKEVIKLSILTWISLIIVTVVSLSVSFTFPQIFGDFFSMHISSLLITFLMILLLPINILKKSKLFKFFGKIAYEFFLIHPLIIQFVNNNDIFLGPTKNRICCYWPYIYSLKIENRFLQIFLIFLFTTIIAYIMNYVNTKIFSVYSNLLSNKSLKKH